MEKMTEQEYDEKMSTIEGRAEMSGRTINKQAKFELAMLKSRNILMRGGRK